MSRDELAVMDGSKCVLQLRGVRPFLSDKYDLTQHPNYKYTADYDKKIGIWGAINLLEGYGNDNPGAKSQGMKQLMAGGGVALISITLVPLLSGLFG